ncbi:hypothetical protein KC330_g214 [Hortaea werneckii]|nr:hypothetical protein KC330_g214 [Hortaea werneckii]
MEHLLLPHNTKIHAEEKVTFIAEGYDGGPFLTFPERSSRFRDLYEEIEPTGRYRSFQADLSSEQRGEVQVLIQTWLVLGLLNEVFASYFKPEEEGEEAEGLVAFFRTQDVQTGEVFLSTSQLPMLVDRWLRDHSALHGTEEGKFLDRFPEADGYAECSFVVRGFFGRDAGVCCFGDAGEGPGFAELMERNGWCPADVAIWLQAADGVQTLFYLSKLEQPLRKDHGRCQGSNVCQAMQYDMSKGGGMIHRCADGSCDILEVDVEAMKTTFDNGTFGLLEFSTTDTNELFIRVVPYHPTDDGTETDTPYVALSHVWAEGLGNPVANALPRCQLNHVYRSVEQLRQELGLQQRKLLVWLDTLCYATDLPRRDSRSRPRRPTRPFLRLRARLGGDLRPLAVLDLDAAAVDFTGRRACSAALGAVGESPGECRFEHNQLALMLVSGLKRLRNFGGIAKGKKDNDSRHREPSLIDVHMAFRNRSVSVPSDEALCLCTCLAIDQTLVVQAPNDERLAAFWVTMGAVAHISPQGLLVYLPAIEISVSHGDCQWRMDILRETGGSAVILQDIGLDEMRESKGANNVAKGLIGSVSDYSTLSSAAAAFQPTSEGQPITLPFQLKTNIFVHKLKNDLPGNLDLVSQYADRLNETASSASLEAETDISLPQSQYLARMPIEQARRIVRVARQACRASRRSEADMVAITTVELGKEGVEEVQWLVSPLLLPLREPGSRASNDVFTVSHERSVDDQALGEWKEGSNDLSVVKRSGITVCLLGKKGTRTGCRRVEQWEVEWGYGERKGKVLPGF